MGKVESGTVRVGMGIRVMPVNVRGKVDKIYVNEVEVLQALPGENIKLKVKGITEADVHKGCVVWFCVSLHVSDFVVAAAVVVVCHCVCWSKEPVPGWCVSCVV
jgi:translation elongation factor EF-1alpha